MKRSQYSLQRYAYHATRSFLRQFFIARVEEKMQPEARKTGIKVAFIHNEKRIHTGLHTGAAQINRLMASALAKRGVSVRDFYPRHQLADTPIHLRGIANILFFYSLLEYKDSMLKFDIIQGTTYTPLPFLAFDTPVVCHFGSTIRGFLQAVPKTKQLPAAEQNIFKELVRLKIVPEIDLKTFRPMEDVADIEAVAASRAAVCIATSEKVKHELVAMGTSAERISVIPNAIEDYWFSQQRAATTQPPHLVFLGRLGNDVFTLKLKGLSRLINFYRAFPGVPKTTICMTTNKRLKEWLRVAFPKHHMFVNLRKDLIPGALAPLYGSILFLSSRYEGFSLSLIEGMSQGLVPISFSVGVAPEIIVDGQNGYIVSSTDEAIVRARELLRDDDLRLKLAAAAKQTACEFRSEKIADQLLSLYRTVKDNYKKSKRGTSE